MNIKKKIKFLSWIIVVIIIVACNDKKGQNELKNEQPTIDIVSQSVPTISEYLCNASFDNVLKIFTGDTMSFVFSFKAQNPLSQYKIDIHNNFDCHAHGKSIPWSVLKLSDLKGKEAMIEETLIVPQDAAAGNYHLMIRLLDVYGLEAEVKEFNLIIINAEDQTEPIINIETPMPNQIFQHGNEVSFKGKITDNKSLKDSRYELKFTDANQQTYNLYEIFYTPETTISYNIDTTYTIGVFIATGNGFFTIKAYDQANNYAIKTIPIIIE